MESEDMVMIDVDHDQSQPQDTANPISSNWTMPPNSPQELYSAWTIQTSTAPNIAQFLTRWPPSRTPAIYGPWIYVERGDDHKLSTAPPDLKGLSASFQTLALTGTVTLETLDQISKIHNVLSGKWMIFEEPDKIDALWVKVVYHLCIERQKGCAKVSTRKGGERQVICVYVDDYTDLEELNGLRNALKMMGVVNRIGFKPDAYTHLNIYKENAWKIRPSRYLE